MDLFGILGGTAGIIALIAILIGLGRKDQKLEDVSATCKNCKIGQVEKDLAVLTREVQLTRKFNEAMAMNMGNIVREKTHLDRDILVDKLISGTINLKEAQMLATILRNRIQEGGLEVCMTQAQVCTMKDFGFRMLLTFAEQKIDELLDTDVAEVG
jgi:hypothetical protein